MSNRLFLICFVWVLMFCNGFCFSLSFASKEARDVDGVLPHSKTQKDGGLGVKTKHSFEDLVIQGKFRKALEEVRIIDSDKEFGRLIRPREDFIDRMEFLE